MNRILVLILLVIALAAAAGVAYRATTRQAGDPPPDVSAELTDPPVRELLETSRAAVLAAPRDGAAWGELGLAFDAHDQGPEATACYRRATELAADDARWPFLLALRLSGADRAGADAAEAERMYRLAADRTPPSDAARWTATLALADLLADQGRADEAGPLYDRAFAADPANPWAAYRAAGRMADAGRTDEAIRTYLSLARSPHARKKSAVALAELHRRIGRMTDAAGFEGAANQLPADPGWPNPYADAVGERRRGRGVLMNRFVAQEAARDDRGAVETAAAMAEQYPSAESQMLLLRALVNAGDYPAAAAVGDDVLRTDPGMVTAHAFLGLARLGLADRAEAAGRADETTRLLTAAAGDLRQSVRLKPDYVPGYLYLAKAESRLGRHADAERAARDAIRVRPEEWEAYQALGEALAAAGRKPDARAAFEQAAKLADPREPRPRRALADLDRR